MSAATSRAITDTEHHPWRDELEDFGRAFAGAFLFGIPLLYTMEMWWLGSVIGTPQLLLLVGVAFAVNLGLAYTAGFKQESTFRNRVDQAMDAVAVGIVGSAIVLITLNVINLSDPLDSILGAIIVQAVPLSIGASVANAILGRDRQAGPEAQAEPPSAWRALVNDLGATAVGAIFLSFSIAPTDEIPLLASGMGEHHLLALVVLSLLVSYLIVFVSGFARRSREPNSQRPFQRPESETTLAYVVSLLVSLCALVLLQRIGADDSPSFVLAQMLVLGLPACVGGAAGRLAL